MISNILKLFTKEEYEHKDPGDLAEIKAEQEDCLPCIATSAALLTGLGAYLASGVEFKTQKPSPAVSVRYMKGLRVFGFLLLPLGLARAYQGYAVYKRQTGPGK